MTFAFLFALPVLSILLQATEQLPTNIWTVGGALGLFAAVIAYLFKLYDKSQEKRLNEMKVNLEQQIQQLSKALDEEKTSRRGLQDKMDTMLIGNIQESRSLMEDLRRLLNDISKKIL